MPDPKTLILPGTTAEKSGRTVAIEYRASVDFAEKDAMRCLLLAPAALQPGRLIGLRLVWYWSAPEGSAEAPHWEFDRHNSRVIAQRRTAKTAAAETSWGSALTRTLQTIDDDRILLADAITLRAPADEPVLTWMHRDR